MKAPTVIAAGFALVLTGCVSLLPEPDVPGAVYRIPNAGAAVELGHDIVVREPTSPRLFGGQGMVAENPQGGLALVDGAEWADRLTRSLQHSLIESLSGAGEGTPIAAETGAPGRFELSWHVSDMTLVTRSGGQEFAGCQLSMTLLDGRTRAPLARTTISADNLVSGTSTVARANALTSVASSCIAEAANWLADAVDQPAP